MPIKWNALMVNEAMDMAEEYVNQAIEPSPCVGTDAPFLLAKRARKGG